MKKDQNIFTVDVEEYYHAENICRSLPAERLKGLLDRVDIGVNKILDLLAQHDSRATFFVLGCVAEKHRSLIKKVADSGHEIASHGYEHIPLHMHTPETFDTDLGRSIKILSDLTGQKIIGYRATSFSLAPDMDWFFEILKKHGMVYDSSLALSLFRKRYHGLWSGITRSGKNLGIVEFPPSCIRVGPLTLPIGGGYFRVYPYWLTAYGLSQAVSERGSTPLFYIHPWELDPDQPRLQLSMLKSMRHYSGLKTVEEKLRALLSGRKFSAVRECLP